jgi:hypothetical protein
MKYIIEKLDKEDRIIRFYGELKELKNYTIDINDIVRYGFGGAELLVYSFLMANAGDYWEKGENVPTGRIFLEIEVFDLVRVTGCSAQEIRNALFILNEARWVRVAEVKHECGIFYAFHATC